MYIIINVKQKKSNANSNSVLVFFGTRSRHNNYNTCIILSGCPMYISEYAVFTDKNFLFPSSFSYPSKLNFFFFCAIKRGRLNYCIVLLYKLDGACYSTVYLNTSQTQRSTMP